MNGRAKLRLKFWFSLPETPTPSWAKAWKMFCFFVFFWCARAIFSAIDKDGARARIEGRVPVAVAPIFLTEGRWKFCSFFLSWPVLFSSMMSIWRIISIVHCVALVDLNLLNFYWPPCSFHVHSTAGLSSFNQCPAGWGTFVIHAIFETLTIDWQPCFILQPL